MSFSFAIKRKEIHKRSKKKNKSNSTGVSDFTFIYLLPRNFVHFQALLQIIKQNEQKIFRRSLHVGISIGRDLKEVKKKRKTKLHVHC